MSTVDLLECLRDYPARPMLFIQKLRDLQLADEQIAGVVNIIDEICNECWDYPAPCSCWNDA